MTLNGDLPGTGTPLIAGGMTSAELLARLQRHYIKPGPLPGGIFVPECGLNESVRQQRCDALYVGFTSTSGRLLIGHELKVRRADWRHELDQVDKAGRWADQCHQWYVVAPSTDVVPPDELPEGWGLMVPGRSKTRLDVKIRARAYADRDPSWVIVRSVMARQDTLRAAAINRAHADAVVTARERAEREMRARVAASQGDAGRLQEKIQKIEAAIGCELRDSAWSDGQLSFDELAQAVGLVRAVRPLEEAARAIEHRYQNPAVRLREITSQLEEGMAAVRAVRCWTDRAESDLDGAG